METGEHDQLELLLEKHRHEKKELQARITALRKSMPKNDKKKRKEITDEIAKIETELTERHKQEMESVKSTNSNNDEKKEEEEIIKNHQEEPPQDDDEDNSNVKLTRAQRRRMKKEVENKERDLRITEQEKLNKQGPRQLELNSIQKVLKEEKLALHNIPADGNCLYYAIQHQLEETEREALEVNELRKKTADFIRTNKDDFLPFMYNETEDLVNDEQFETYCNEVANTKLWGGQLELRALSNLLECPIKIIQATGPPTLQGEQFKGKPLVLTYHRHLYKLGEHYNSTIEIEQK